MSRYFGLESLDTMITDVTQRINAIPLPDETQLNDMLAHVVSELELLGDIEALRQGLADTRKRQSQLQKRILDFSVRLNKQEKAQEVDADRRKWSTKLAKLDLDLDPASIKDMLDVYRRRASELRQFMNALTTKDDIESKLAELGVTSAK